MQDIFSETRLVLEFSGYTLIMIGIGMIIGIVFKELLTELLTKKEDKDDETNDKRDRETIA